METQITQGVEVNVETYYQEQYSKPDEGKYMFAYRVTISNHNLFTVQLMERKWKITDANREVRMVEGEGVVGRQPVLYAGDSFQYISGCDFNTPIGKMEGVYIFENRGNNSRFEVQIPSFKMAAPNILN